MALSKKFPLQKTQSLPPLAILILALLAYLFDNQVSEILVYKVSGISNGEYWRLLSAHFFHTNFNHFILNIAGLVLLWSLHGRFYTASNYTCLFLTSALFTSLGIYFFTPQIHQYVGLSGVLHGIFVWGAIMDIKAKDKTGYLLLLGVWLKVIHEQVYGASEETASLIAANVAVDAHLYGAIAGLLFAVFSWKLATK